jgi:formylglycine-generating enzyme required for sulfatase activity
MTRMTRPPHKDMVWVPGGTFLMGSEDFYPEERLASARAQLLPALPAGGHDDSGSNGPRR